MVTHIKGLSISGIELHACPSEFRYHPSTGANYVTVHILWVHFSLQTSAKELEELVS